MCKVPELQDNRTTTTTTIQNAAMWKSCRIRAMRSYNRRTNIKMPTMTSMSGHH
jgi:hypothetical protein